MKAGAGCLNSGKQVVVVVAVFVVDAVGNHFGVGLRLKRVAQALQAGAFGFEVFDNAVVNHGDLLLGLAGYMRVGIGLGNAAVGGPAGVADAQVAVHAFGNSGFGHQGHAANTAHAFDAAGGAHGNAGGVVATVFQPFQAVGEKINHIVVGADGANDAAHN